MTSLGIEVGWKILYFPFFNSLFFRMTVIYEIKGYYIFAAFYWQYFVCYRFVRHL